MAIPGGIFKKNKEAKTGKRRGKKEYIKMKNKEKKDKKKKEEIEKIEQIFNTLDPLQ